MKLQVTLHTQLSCEKVNTSSGLFKGGSSYIDEVVENKLSWEFGNGKGAVKFLIKFVKVVCDEFLPRPRLGVGLVLVTIIIIEIIHIIGV